jgi:MoaA/NifB/PqqE/SkfB family radical SAM enzyme
MSQTIRLDLPYGSITGADHRAVGSVLEACARHLHGRRRILLYGFGPAGAMLRPLFQNDARFELVGVADRRASTQEESGLLRPEDLGALQDLGCILVTTSPEHYPVITRTIRHHQPDVPILFLFQPQGHTHVFQGATEPPLGDAAVDRLGRELVSGDILKGSLELRDLRLRHPEDARLSVLAETLRHIVLEKSRDISPLIDDVPGPYITNIQIADQCNLRCFMCVRRRLDVPPSPFSTRPMSREAFAAIVSAIPAHTTDVFLGGSGEAFLHKDLLYFTDFLLARNKRVHVITNGTLLSPSLADALGHRHGFDLQLSLDGMTKATYESIRTGARLEPVIANFSRLAGTVAANGTDSLLEIATVLMRRNIEEFPKIIAFAAELGLARVIGLFLFMQGDAPKTPEESLIFHPELYNDVRAQCLSLSRRLGVTVVMPKALPLEEPEDAGLSRPAPHALCTSPWTRMDMSVGGYSVCCNGHPAVAYDKAFLAGVVPDPFTFQGMTGYPSLHAAFNGERHRVLRRALLTGKPPAVCRDCRNQNLTGGGYFFESAFSRYEVEPELFTRAKALFRKKFAGTPYLARMLPDTEAG